MSKDQVVSAAFAHSPLPSVVLRCGSNPIVVSANLAFCTEFNCTFDELLNTELTELPDNFLKALHLDLTELSDLLSQVIQTRVAIKKDIQKGSASPSVNGKAYHREYFQIFPIEQEGAITYLVLQLELLSLANTESSAGEIKTNPSAAPNQSLELLIDSLSNVIFTLDIESAGVYRFSFVNRAFQVTTGLPIDKVIGRYVHEIIPEPSLTLVLEKYREVIETRQGVSWQEVSHYPAGQKTGEVLVVPVFNAAGECFRLAGLVHDVTPFKEAEAKQMRLMQDLYQQNSDLQQFTYIISHNLRAPLANAMGLARQLEVVDPGTADFKQYLTFLRTSIESLDRILLDLNQILSIRDKQDHASLETVSLLDVCHQAAFALRQELVQTGGQISIKINENFRVEGIQAYIYSICYNLLSNAIKFRKKDRPLRIEVSSECEGEDGPAIHFKDNGSGIDMDKAGQNLFKLYKRFHRDVEGRGMGLFLVKSHMEALKGRIKVESQLNKGTTVSIFFEELIS